MPNLTEREMDVAIDADVFGHTHYSTISHEDGSELWFRFNCEPDAAVPHYSTSISDAFAVVEKMREMGRNFGLCALGQCSLWTVSFEPWAYGMKGEGYSSKDSLPLAICTAALNAVDEEALRASETHPIAQSVDSAHTQHKEKL